MNAQDHATIVVFEERIAALVDYRAWFRRLSPHMQGAFRTLDAEYRAELRALLRIRSKARRASRAAEVARTHAVDARVDRALDAMYDDNREGDPAFNGAFNRW